MTDETEPKPPTPSWRTREHPGSYAPNPLYDHRTRKLMKYNARGELVEDRRGKDSPIAKGTDFNPFTGKPD